MRDVALFITSHEQSIKFQVSLQFSLIDCGLAALEEQTLPEIL